jgi:hypothetical protein
MGNEVQKTRHTQATRILALDVHPRSFGYVVVESPDKLLDWGVRSHRGKGNSADVLIRRRLTPLLERWRPSILVLCSGPSMTQRAHQRRDRLLKRIMTEAENHQVLVHTFRRRPGADQGKRLTKYENARRAAEQFSVLSWNMPPKRRAWGKRRLSNEHVHSRNSSNSATQGHELLPGTILATIFPMTCGSCSPAAPSRV